MTPREIVDRFYDEIWNRQDLSAIPRLCDERLEFRGSLGAERRGHEGFAEYVRSVTQALGEYHCAIQDIVVEGNRAFARMLFSGVHRGPLLGFEASGRRVEWTGAALFTTEQGRVRSLWVLGDLHSLTKQLSAGDARPASEPGEGDPRLAMEWKRDGFTISTDPERLDRKAVHRFLSASYWARGILRSMVDRSIDNSLVFGLYEGKRQVGFARVITDRATFGYPSDVYVEESHRRRGLSKWLTEVILSHPDLQGLRRWVLVTRDAQELYRRFGFHELENPERYMEILGPTYVQITTAQIEGCGSDPAAASRRGSIPVRLRPRQQTRS